MTGHTDHFDLLIKELEESLEDGFLSRREKKSLRELLGTTYLNDQQLGQLRKKVFDLATAKADASNFRVIIEWIEKTLHTIGNHRQFNNSVLFSPGTDCRNAIIDQIEQANKYLKICVFTISDNHISNTLLRAHNNGLNIQILTDNDKSFDRGSDIYKFDKAGMQVKMDTTSNHMHHKFMVVDGRLVLTGSYNWTRSAADYNHENILITAESQVIKSYEKEFDKLWLEMAPY